MSGTSAAAPPAIFLHIGRNKAGSTSLQAFFAAHADFLADRSIRYGLYGHLAGTNPALPSWPTHPDLIADFHAAAGASLLVSSELIAAYSDDLTVRMASDLAGLNVRVILYVRPYRAWVRSSYAFDIRIGWNSLDFDAYLERAAPLISFWPMLQIWGETIGWDRVRVRSTDRRDLAGGELITDCLSALGLPLPPGTAHTASNAAPHWIATELQRLVVQEAPKYDPAVRTYLRALMHALADEAIAACGAAGSTAAYATRDQALRLIDQYNSDLDRVQMHTGANLQRDDPRQAAPRAFLPSASRIPMPVLAHIQALALGRDDPPARAFVTSAAFLDALSGTRQREGEGK